MSTRKIAELPKPCRHPEHNPPSMQVFRPGVYEHECPACGAKQVFRVDGVMLTAIEARRRLNCTAAAREAYGAIYACDRPAPVRGR